MNAPNLSKEDREALEQVDRLRVVILEALRGEVENDAHVGIIEAVLVDLVAELVALNRRDITRTIGVLATLHADYISHASPTTCN